MSLETWKQKYYSVNARELKKGNALLAVDHSLRKWRGLRPDVLARHGLQTDGNIIAPIDGQSLAVFYADSNSCALCVKFLPTIFGERCTECPLHQVRLGTRCDAKMTGEKLSPYDALTINKDPEPMIAWLEEAMALELKENGS